MLKSGIRIKSKFLLLIIIFATILVYGAENIPPSQKNPGNLDSTQIPMFISLGFDDNKFADGVEWVWNGLLRGRYNPQGAGNKATYDGTPMAADIYVIGNSDFEWSEDPYHQPIPANRPVTEAWINAYKAGIGINNHTWTHLHNLSDLSYDQWKGELPPLLVEIGMCSQYLVNVAGIPFSEIYGFRTPYLASSVSDNLSYKATWDLGMLYDCTLDNGLQGSQQADWALPYFPGTLNNGWIWWTSMAVEGLWEVPNGIYPTTEGGTFSVKGFDSGTTNGWPSGATAQDLFNQMKWAISWHYKKNRAPIDLGLHSDYYSEEAQNTPGTAANGFKTPLSERRKALTMLLDWIQDSLPDARVVRKIDIIRWMRKPVALNDLSRNEELTFKTDNPSGLLTNALPFTDQNGSSCEITETNGKISANVTVVDKKDWKIDGYAGIVFNLTKNMKDVHSVRIKYKSTMPLRLVLVDENFGAKSYGTGLMATKEERTVEMPVIDDYFELQRPYPSDAKLDLSKIQKVAVIAQAFDSTISGSFEIETEFFGAGELTGTSVSQNNLKSQINKTIIKNGKTVKIMPPVKGLYTINIYNYNGRLLKRLSKHIFNEIKINLNNLPQGSYIIEIKNSGFKTAKLISL